MKVVKRAKDGIDILEHAMQGVHISQNRGEILRFHTDRAIVRKDSKTEVRALDDSDQEREVIVRVLRPPHGRRQR